MQIFLLDIIGDDFCVSIQVGTQVFRFVYFFPVSLNENDNRCKYGEYQEEIEEQFLFIR